MTTTRACSCGAIAHYEHPETGPDLCVTCHHDLAEGAQVNLESYTIIPNPDGEGEEAAEPAPEPPVESLHWRLTGYAGALDTAAKEGINMHTEVGMKTVSISATFAHRLAQEFRRAALWVGEYVPNRWTGAPLPLDYDPRTAPREQPCPYCEKETLARRAPLPGHWTCTECDGCYADSIESLADAAIASSPLLSRVVGCRHSWAERVSMSPQGAQFEGLVCSRCGLETTLPQRPPQGGVPLRAAGNLELVHELGDRIVDLETSKRRGLERSAKDPFAARGHRFIPYAGDDGRAEDGKLVECQICGEGETHERHVKKPALELRGDQALGEIEPQDPLLGTTGFETQAGDLDGGAS